MGARVVASGGRRPPAADAAGRARSAADRVPNAGGLGPDQVRGAAGGAGRARRHHRDRDRGDPRPHRADAEAFRRARSSRRREGSHGRRIALHGQPELHGADVVVPADPSSAAFPIVAALIVQGSDLVLSDVMTNPLRTGLFTTLREMGASIEESSAFAAMPASRCRRSARARLETARRRGAAGTRALDDRRISGAGGGGGLCRGHHHHARPAGIARQGIRPAGSHRRHAARQRRQGRDRGRRPDRRKARAMFPAAAWSPPIWTIASRCRRW